MRPFVGSLRTVATAVDKLQLSGSLVEPVQASVVFDLASLILYGAHATPIRSKILLDRLFSVLSHEEVIRILARFGWTYEDYARGYVLQDQSGRVLDKWTMATREEENSILQQFLRFGETKSIAQDIINQEAKDALTPQASPNKANDVDIKQLIERTSLAQHNFFRQYDPRLFAAAHPAHFAAMAAARFFPFAQNSEQLKEEVKVSDKEVDQHSTSPTSSSSPLNKLQTMQPFDFRRNSSPDTAASDMSMSPATSPISFPKPVVRLAEPRYPQVHDQPSEEALDLSGKGSEDGNNNGRIDLNDKRHARKSATPIKRQWNPTPAFGSTLISPSGKKRVLCTACNKTFCDKGALKIHYSAVHLKEMHKCTVEGCNMMFSSRRSRNRHSANPNPKLHLPQKKKELPDGARIVDDGTTKTSLPSSLLTPPPTLSSIMPLSVRTGEGVTPPLTYLEASAFAAPAAKLARLSTNTDEEVKEVEKESKKPESKPERSSNKRKGVPTRVPRAEELEAKLVALMEEEQRKNNPESEEIEEANFEGVSSDSDGETANWNLHGKLPPTDENGTTEADDEQLENAPKSDPQGEALCHVCNDRFRDNLVLKEHTEKVHPREVFHCTVSGCDKIFSTRKSRNRHSQNDNLHRHLAAAL
ncbi:DgyrCDS14035 [Dimorphilus gyrociliatus]|uniref:DgyrCDS14035 n=1 Tax=Dimorphilus gyrociliatus TaxID=2664684 RepID=A0A7I8WCE0_9ANNE|nr:DgyrCDS14035 [Dimorphilus gyrociliatus]